MVIKSGKTPAGTPPSADLSAGSNPDLSGFGTSAGISSGTSTDTSVTAGVSADIFAGTSAGTTAGSACRYEKPVSRAQESPVRTSTVNKRRPGFFVPRFIPDKVVVIFTSLRKSENL
jgi:hypothetical protein